jgi:tetratricopeptide (TPR) repeat protein
MKPSKKIENAIRNRLRFTAAPTLRRRWWTDVMEAQAQSQGFRPALHEPFIGRTIMRSPIIKLTSVAAVLAVAVLSIVFWSRSGSPAYALEQTVEALQNVRFLHVVARDETGQVSDERWIEIGMNGRQVRYRQQNPLTLLAQSPGTPSMVIEDAESVAVYREDKKAVILYGKDNQYQWIGPLGEFFENLRQKGKILKENDTYQGRPAHKVWWPAVSAECYVDPQTKLPLTIGTAMLSYEQPPAGTFDIVIPDGYAVLDKRPGAVATAVPDWLQQEDRARTNEEEAFDRGTHAFIRGDYPEAARQLEQATGHDTWAWFWLGKSYYELGQYELAVKDFDVVFDAFKKMGSGDTVPFCQYARGLAHARLGKLDQATADLQACLPVMIETLRTPSGGSFFEYADSPLIRYGKQMPGDSEMVIKMINRLRLISGQDFGYDPYGTPEQNEAAITAWEQWFKNGGRIQFTPDAQLLSVPTATKP